MLKKISFIAVAMTTSLLAMETDQFNPEQADFSKMETLRTWVSSKYQSNNEKMKEIQRNVAMEVPENTFSYNFVRPIRNNDGDTRYFGKTFHTLKSVQLPFLQFVHEISKNKNPVVLEIAASYGLVTWKIPYTFENGGTVYANELSSIMLNDEFDSVMNARLNGDNLSQIVHKIPGDCFNISSEHPELIGQVDAIFVQNLEHFFNPVQHQDFLKLLDTLLVESGRAFLASHTMQPGTAKRGNPIYELYINKKTSDMYPGFMRCIGVCQALKSGALAGEVVVSEATRPNDSTICSTRTLGVLDSKIINTQHGLQEVKTIKQEVISQFFTPSIYKSSIVPHKSLKMIDSFFMDQIGSKYEKFNDNLISHAVAIIEKVVVSN